ncbi:hypothetical protein [Gallaecimonas mangrovi]|uniref:hypothetical protein n=1 Tax=Gallaecimonas mangrovi TaxID=2291597 RepID=UPI000E202A1B|nr:hypothetical protein [Gallaecimonas mangrovi]
MKLIEWFEALARREKLLVMAAGWVLLIGGLGLSWLQPLLTSNAAVSKLNAQQRAELKNLDAQLAVVDAKLAADPNLAVHQEIVRLQDERQTLEQKIHQGTQSLVPPEAMASLLRALLSGTGQLQLVKLESEPAKPLAEDKDKDQKAGQLYRHGLVLTLKGSYLPTLEFLKQVEKLPWRFYWQSLDFKQSQYPDANIQIHVYTLGTSTHYLGA